jgi:hypothetical protein
VGNVAKEQKLYNRIISDAPLDCMLYRNNVGTGYQGQKGLVNGQEVITNPRIINFGLCVGSSDLIGYTEVLITPEMVGRRIAVFTAIEVKLPGKKERPEQARYIKNVQNSGGIAGVANGAEDVARIIEEWRVPF